MHNEPTPQPVTLIRLAPDQHRQLLDELRAHMTEHRRHAQHLRSIRRSVFFVAIFASFSALASTWLTWEYIGLKVGLAEFSREMEAKYGPLPTSPRRSR